jgi:two-component system, OmpR family, sensor kinase
VSLRARLVIGLLVLAAAGLIVAGAVTYAEQRSFLFDRVDQQAHAALPAVSHELDLQGANVPGYEPDQGPFGGERDGRPPPPGGPGAPGDRGAPGGPGGGPAAANLPPGTFGQRRDADGDVVGDVALSYGQEELPKPHIPADIEPGDVKTVPAVGSSELEYRAVAERTGDQPGTTIAAVPLEEVHSTLERLLRVEALVIGGVLVALAVFSLALVRLGLRPLDRIGETAGAIAAGDLSRRVSPANPRTEVGRLGMALNAMLARLEQAFADKDASESRLRRFLADASHELRTPLASIRGYAEVFRLGAARKPQDLERSMQRIESEAARMGVVVEDLLTLARLDEVRPLARERVNFAELARDAVSDARASDPGRPISIDAPAQAFVIGDAHMLRQVLANLVQNARVHTPAGTAIEVRVTEQGEAVGLEVRDHGPGLPSDDPGELFERFWRAEKGRERGRAGSGLGLAIVAGIVAAHGGSVAASNADGGGARFSVRLPVEAPAEAAAQPASV